MSHDVVERREWGRPLTRHAVPAICSLTAILATTSAAIALGDRSVAVDAPVPDPASWFVVVQITAAAVWLGAALVLRRRPDLAWGTLAAIAALSHALAAAGYSWAVHRIGQGTAPPSWAVWLPSWTLAVEVPVSTWMFVTVPTGRLAPGRLGRIGLAATIAGVIGVALSALSDPDVAGTDFADATNPITPGLSFGLIIPLLIGGSALIALGALIARWRSTSGRDRVALRRIVVISMASIAIVPLVVAGPPGLGVGVAQILGAIGTLALLAIVLRHQLLGIETVLDRSIRYTALALVLLAVNVALVTAGEALLGDAIGPIAAVAVALAALPLHDRLSRAITRFVYGDGHDSALLVGTLVERLGMAGSPSEVLGDAVRTLTTGLDVTGAAVIDRTSGEVVVRIGSAPAADATSFDLTAQGLCIGELRVAAHPKGVPLDDVDRRVLADLAPHLAMLLAATSAAEALRTARSDLVTAREEERRRLRHDLHDGLGPVLTGATMSLDAASNLLHTDVEHAAAMLAQARDGVADAIVEIRRIVEDLRPPALDELGLRRALAQHADRYPGLQVTIDLTDDLDGLPAALEVCAYRIITEAVANAARHAGATRTVVSGHVDADVHREIVDDGGSGRPWVPGVGLSSMAERAAELGGTLQAGPSARGGSVVARLPVGTT